MLFPSRLSFQMNAKIVVVRISWNLSLGTKFHFNVNSSKKKNYCIDHQDDTWLQTESTQKKCALR